MSSLLRVGVVFGGRSSEKEVSLATGRYVYSLLDHSRFVGVPFFMDSDGHMWKVPEKLVILNTTADVVSRLSEEARRIRYQDLTREVDVIFIALLGKYGEDGCIQGALELSGIPYTGSGVLASALGMDKKVHKQLLRHAAIRVPRDLVVGVEAWTGDTRAQTVQQIVEHIGLPCVTKPSREGSSIGVSVVSDEDDLQQAMQDAFRWDTQVLVEEYIRGAEFMCVVWGNEEPKAMLPTEVVFEGDFFTYDAKYMPGRTQLHTPARFAPETIEEVRTLAVQVYELIGCKGYGRVDGLVTEDGICVMEPHTGTIMVPSSFVFQQAAKFRIQLEGTETAGKAETGLSPREMVTGIVEMALDAHGGKIGPLR